MLLSGGKEREDHGKQVRVLNPANSSATFVVSFLVSLTSAAWVGKSVLLTMVTGSPVSFQTKSRRMCMWPVRDSTDEMSLRKIQ